MQFTTASLLLMTLCLFSGCGNRMEIGRLEYYRVEPRIPSHPVKSPKKNHGFTVVWGVLGTIRPDGPIMKPVSIRIGGETYPAINWKYRLHDHLYYYLFVVPGPLGDGFPHDLGTGNLFSQDAATRSKAPIQVKFVRQHDQSTWTGLGTVEQASMLQMQAAEDSIEGSTDVDGLSE